MAWLLKVMGLSSGVSWIVYVVVFGLGVAAGAGPAYVWERRAVIAADAKTEAALAKLAGVELERDIWKGSYESAAAALKDMRRQADAEHARAEAITTAERQAVADAEAKRAAAETKLGDLRAALDAASRKPGATAASVGRAAIEGLGR